jgi:hypothetical protein
MRHEAVILEGTIIYDSYGHRFDQINIELKLRDGHSRSEIDLLKEMTDLEDRKVKITIEILG